MFYLKKYLIYFYKNLIIHPQINITQHYTTFTKKSYKITFTSTLNIKKPIFYKK